MKTYKVKLKDKNGNVVLSHNLAANNMQDAENRFNKAMVDLRNKNVASYELSETR